MAMLASGVAGAAAVTMFAVVGARAAVGIKAVVVAKAAPRQVVALACGARGGTPGIARMMAETVAVVMLAAGPAKAGMPMEVVGGHLIAADPMAVVMIVGATEAERMARFAAISSTQIASCAKK